MGAKDTNIQTVTRDSTPPPLPTARGEVPAEPGSPADVGPAGQASTVSVPVENPRAVTLSVSAFEVLADHPKNLVEVGRVYLHEGLGRVHYVRPDKTVVGLQTHDAGLDLLAAAPDPGKGVILAGRDATAWGALVPPGDGMSLVTDAAQDLGYAWTKLQPQATRLDQLAATAVARGSLFVSNNLAWASFPPGTDGQALVADSGELFGLRWDDIDPGLTTEFSDGDFLLKSTGNPADTLRFDLSGLSAARSLKVPDADGTVALQADLGGFVTDVFPENPITVIRNGSEVQLGVKLYSQGGIHVDSHGLRLKVPAGQPLRTEEKGVFFLYDDNHFGIAVGVDPLLTILEDAITARELAPNSVSSVHLVDGSIGLDDIGPGSPNQVLISDAEADVEWVDQRSAFNRNFGPGNSDVAHGDGTENQQFTLGLGGDPAVIRAPAPDMIGIYEGDGATLAPLLAGGIELDAAVLLNRGATLPAHNATLGVTVVRYDSGSTRRDVSVRWDEGLTRFAVTEPNNADTGLVTKAVARVHAETIGNGAATLFEVQHDLGSEDVLVQVWDATGSPKEEIKVEVRVQGPDIVEVQFGSAPATNSRRVVVMG